MRLRVDSAQNSLSSKKSVRFSPSSSSGSRESSRSRASGQAYNEWPNDQGFETEYEQHDPISLLVSGNIPWYAAGVLYRTGPSGYKVKSNDGSVVAMSHWFDGFSQIHRFRIEPTGEDGGSVRVMYNSRKTVDNYVRAIQRGGPLGGFTFGQKKASRGGLRRKLSKRGSMLSLKVPEPIPEDTPSSRNIGVTVSVNMPGQWARQPGRKPMINSTSPHPKTLHMKTDNNSFSQINPKTLEPMGTTQQEALHPELTGSLSCAHAKSDPATGNLYNYNLDLTGRPTYRIFRVSASTGETTILASIRATPAYLHSLFLTADHVILCVWNSHFAKGGKSLQTNRNILDSIEPFDESKPATWYVVDRRHNKGLLATYESNAFFCFHTVNAWQERSPSSRRQTDIVAELIMYENHDILKHFYYENLLSTSPHQEKYRDQTGETTRGNLRRFRLPNIPKEPTQEIMRVEIESTACKNATPELPTINPLVATQPHRYIYGVCDRGLSTFVDGLVKYDNDTQEALYWQRYAHSPGEAIFIADPDGTEEDHGVLLSVVLDGRRGKSYLLCLDARNMQEMGRADVDGAIGFGFHGVHVSADGLHRPPDF